MATDESVSIKKALKLKTPKLIKLVEERQMLWDTECPNFYDMPKRMRLWMEICRHLFPKFDEYETKKQKNLMSQLKIRWRNLRTAYVRHKKNPNQTRPYYVYDSEMAFYMKRLERQNLKEPGDSMFLDDDWDDDEQPAISMRPKKAATKRARTKQEPIELTLLASEIYEGPTPSDQQMQLDYDDLEHFEIASQPNVKQNVDDEESEPFELEFSHIIEVVDEDEFLKEGTEQQAHKLENTATTSTKVQSESRSSSAKKSPNKAAAGVATSDTKSLSACCDDDGDQAFFDSIKPILRGMRHEQMLDFRIEVMTLVRKYMTAKKTV